MCALKLFHFLVVLTPKTFTLPNLIKLRDSGRVSGVLLLSAHSYGNITSVPSIYSDDQSCPNKISSLYNESYNCPSDKYWNPGGQSILFENWPFPIVLLNNYDTIHFLINDCYNKFNVPADKKNWPLCAIEIDTNMLQAVNSETCLRRSEYLSISGTIRRCDKVKNINSNNYKSAVPFNIEYFFAVCIPICN